MTLEINITDIDMDLDRYSSMEDLRQFYKSKGIDGLELMPCMHHSLPAGMDPGDVIGIHLKFFPCWLEFWRGNETALLAEYGSREVWADCYGGTDREAMLRDIRQELNLARDIGAQYVVFHVSECSLGECLTYEPLHTDLEVVEAAAEVINTLLDGAGYNFWFLTENLWWSGLTLTDNHVTQTLMDRIHYPKKGIILDTGHLLHTNLSLHTQEEGAAYIEEILDRMGPLTGYIKGLHLNQSLSSDYVKSVIANPPVLTGTYQERLCTVYPHISKIDFHEPFTAAGVAPMIRRLRPEFVTIELISDDRQQHEDRLNAQMAALRENGGIR